MAQTTPNHSLGKSRRNLRHGQHLSFVERVEPAIRDGLTRVHVPPHLFIKIHHPDTESP